MHSLDRGQGDAAGRPVPTARSAGPIVIRDAQLPEAYSGWDWAAPDKGGSSASFLKYWHALIKYRWIALSIFVATLVVGIIATLLMTPIYTASTTLQIERQETKILDVGDMTPTEASTGDEFFQTQYGLLKSESLAERVVDSLRLDLDDNFLRTMGVPLDKKKLTPAARRKAAIGQLKKNLGVAPTRGSRLVKVTFDSPKPNISARIANAFADSFITSNLDRRYDSSSYARTFLEGRLKQVKQRLEDSERQLVAYAGQQEIINVEEEASSAPGAPSGGGKSLTSSNLSALNSAFSEAQGERIRAEQRWRQAQSTPDSALPEALTNPTVQQLQQQQAKLKATYQENLKLYKPNFPEMTALQSQIDETDRQIRTTVSGIRGALRAQYETALKQEQSFGGRVTQLKGSYLDLRERSIKYNILQREVDTNRVLYDGLLQRYKEVGVAGGLGSNNISIVDRAKPPGVPSRPKPFLNLAIAALAGLALAVLAALALEYFDESIDRPEDIESKLGVSLLGSVPVLSKGVGVLAALADPRSNFSEAYYSIRTALQFSTMEGVPASVLLTSSRPSEGKSTSALAIARSFAGLGKRVLLVDGDLRNPSLHRTLGADNSFGLSNYLTGMPLEELVQVSDQPNLSIMACGPLPPNPAELLGGPRLRSLLAEAAEVFDLLVIDGPPVLGLADAPILASVVGGTVLVVEAGVTRRGTARAALERLAPGRFRLLGAVLTKFNAKAAGYGYGYGYGYAYDYSYGTKPKLVSTGG